MGYTITLDDGTVLFFRSVGVITLKDDKGRTVKARVFNPRVLWQADNKG